jgi:hypothetical protein
MTGRLATIIASGAILLVALLGAYVATYYATVNVGDSSGSGLSYTNHPAYAIPGVNASWFFYPMHYVDRNFIRPDYWEGTFVIG